MVNINPNPKNIAISINNTLKSGNSKNFSFNYDLANNVLDILEEIAPHKEFLVNHNEKSFDILRIK